MKILLIFTLFGYQTSVFAGDINQQILTCHEKLSSQIDGQLSPLYGAALLHSPALENLRFLGMYGPQNGSDLEKFDQVTDPNDFPLSATSLLIQHLFPSPGNRLEITLRKSFLLRTMPLTILAKLIINLDEHADNYIQGPGKTELYTYLLGNSKSKKSKQLAKKYEKFLSRAVHESRTAPHNLSPKFIQHLLIAYAIKRSQILQENFIDFLVLFQSEEQPARLTKKLMSRVEYSDWKSSLPTLPSPIGKLEPIITGDTLKVLIEDPIEIFRISTAIRQFEILPLIINYGEAKIDDIKFSDCTESGLLSLVGYLLFDTDNNTLDVSRLPESATQEFKEFFEVYDPRKNEQFRSQWAGLLANLKHPRINYVNNTNSTKCELVSGIPNCLIALSELLGEPELANDDISLQERLNKLLSLFFTELDDDKIWIEIQDDFNQGIPEEFKIRQFGLSSFVLKSAEGHTTALFESTNVIPVIDKEQLHTIVTDTIYLPSYAAIIPNMDIIAFCSNTISICERENRSDIYNITRKANCSKILSTNLLLQFPLTSDRGTIALLKLISYQFGFLSHLPSVFPALTYRLPAENSYLYLEIYEALLDFESEQLESIFPGLISRIDAILHKSPVEMLFMAYRRTIFCPNKKEKIMKFTHRQTVIDSLKNQLVLAQSENDHGKFSFLLSGISSTTNEIEATYACQILQLFPVDFLKTKYDGNSALGSKLIKASDLMTPIVQPILDKIDDSTFEEICYAPTTYVKIGDNPCELAPIIFFEFRELDILTYTLKRLHKINPNRLKNQQYQNHNIVSILQHYLHNVDPNYGEKEKLEALIQFLINSFAESF